MGYYTTLHLYSRLKKCHGCKKKKAKILASQIVNGSIETAALCVSCFKKAMPHYTLEKKCINCLDCFNCNIQKILFTPKEIKQFKITLL
nr:MAG: hypothetical protein [uncultured archaeon]